MTRRDYVKFAEVIRVGEYRVKHGGADVLMDVVRYFKEEIADIFASANPRFDRERFYASCEPKKD